jgi:hypothetical protein
MKVFLLILTLVLPLQASAEDSLVGHWFYFLKIFRGQEMPERPEATLRLHYELYEDGRSHLYWWHEGEGDRCETMGLWSVEEGILVDKVTWVDPRNSMACGSDPDMQMGRVTRTPYSFDKGNLRLHLRLSDDWLIYVWKKIGAEGI